jgi:arginase
VLGIVERGAFPLVVGGDHSIACGTVAGLSTHHHRRAEKIGLIWFDAHGDFNTPATSPSGNVHGMPLAATLGYGDEQLTKLGERFPMVDPEHTVLVGVHSLDRGERELILEAGLKVFTVRDVDMWGMHRVMTEAIERATAGTAGFHLSFDVDGCDPAHAPGVGTPVAGGMTLRESLLVMEHAAESERLLGLELTEINPILDTRNQTAEFSRELALSALGKLVL